uniref:Uncharacterized protein n=1 Tax=Anopheles minimus TaxID=112268 RepID=A0A182WMW5_9DIPT
MPRSKPRKTQKTVPRCRENRLPPQNRPSVCVCGGGRATTLTDTRARTVSDRKHLRAPAVLRALLRLQVPSTGVLHWWRVGGGFCRF